MKRVLVINTKLNLIIDDTLTEVENLPQLIPSILFGLLMYVPTLNSEDSLNTTDDANIVLSLIKSEYRLLLVDESVSLSQKDLLIIKNTESIKCDSQNLKSKLDTLFNNTQLNYLLTTKSQMEFIKIFNGAFEINSTNKIYLRW